MKLLITISLFLLLFPNISISQSDTSYFSSFYNKITYPDSLQKQKIEGIVFLEYWVEKDGSITNQKIISSPHSTLSKIVLEASKSLKKIVSDIPEEKTIRIKIVLPINFTLD